MGENISKSNVEVYVGLDLLHISQLAADDNVLVGMPNMGEEIYQRLRLFVRKTEEAQGYFEEDKFIPGDWDDENQNFREGFSALSEDTKKYVLFVLLYDWDFVLDFLISFLVLSKDLLRNFLHIYFLYFCRMLFLLIDEVFGKEELSSTSKGGGNSYLKYYKFLFMKESLWGEFIALFSRINHARITQLAKAVGECD